MTPAPEAPTCPVCRQPMALAFVVEGRGGPREVYKCARCQITRLGPPARRAA